MQPNVPYIAGYLLLLGALGWWCKTHLLGWMRRGVGLCADCGETPCECVNIDFTAWQDMDEDERSCDSCDGTGCPCMRARDWYSMDLGCKDGCGECGLNNCREDERDDA